MTKAPPLPDLEDDVTFRQRLAPLVSSVLPDNRKTGLPRAGTPENRASGRGISATPDSRPSATTHDGPPDNRNTGLVEAAEAQARIEAKRGLKKRFEYMIPERVGRAVAEDAAARGMSATTRLLEVLRDAGYPVIQEDLIDLRKMPRR